MYCQTGWLAKGAFLGILKTYHSVAAEISVEKDILMRGSLVVIPASLRVSMLEKLHTGYQGIIKSQERAKHSVGSPALSR